MSLDRLCIDGVVLLVRADELHENNPVRVVDGRDESVLVTSDIEDHAPLFQDPRGTKVGLDVGRGLPLGLEDVAVPGEKWFFCVGV